MTATSINERISRQIRVELARQDLNQSQLAARCSWSVAYLSRRLTSVVPWTAGQLYAVAKALDIDPLQLINSAQTKTGATDSTGGAPAGGAPAVRSA